MNRTEHKFISTLSIHRSWSYMSEQIYGLLSHLFSWAGYFVATLKKFFGGMTLEFLDPNITFTHTLISLKLHTCLHLKNIQDSVDPARSRKNNAIQTLMSLQYIRIARCVLQYTNSIQFHSQIVSTSLQLLVWLFGSRYIRVKLLKRGVKTTIKKEKKKGSAIAFYC